MYPPMFTFSAFYWPELFMENIVYLLSIQTLDKHKPEVVTRHQNYIWQYVKRINNLGVKNLDFPPFS